MNTLILLQQLFVIFGMMAAGYLAFSAGCFDRVGQHQISTILANVLSPFIILAALAGERADNAGEMMRESFWLALIYYLFLFVCSLVFIRLRRPGKKMKSMYQMMILFSNVGIFAIPLIRGLYGEGYVIYLTFYLLFYNLLFYTLGIFLAMRCGEGGGHRFTAKKILNPGMAASVIALLLFVFQIRIPAPFASLFSYLGNSCITLSMFLVGASLAQIDLPAVLCSGENWIFAAIRMLLIPLLGILLGRLLPFSEEMRTIFFIELTMPVASLVGVLTEEYANRGNEANQTIALSTMLSLVTVPFLSLFF